MNAHHASLLVSLLDSISKNCTRYYKTYPNPRDIPPKFQGGWFNCIGMEYRHFFNENPNDLKCMGNTSM
jgi:hypothetical protein